MAAYTWLSVQKALFVEGDQLGVVFVEGDGETP
jgi:hypothetical protein